MKKSISLLMSLFLILSVLLIPSIAAYNNTDSLDSENSEYSVGIVEKDFETNIVEKKSIAKTLPEMNALKPLSHGRILQAVS